MTDELARVKRIGMSMVPADWELSALAEVSDLRAQKAELLAALRATVQMLEALTKLSPEATMTTRFGKDRAALLVKANVAIAKTESKS